MPPELSVIVVSYNSRPHLDRCLRSIPRTPDVETIVVDNASEDPPGPGLPADRLIRNDTNEGWANAVNRGAAASRGRRLLLLNPDAELVPGALDALRGFFARPPADLGPVGGRLLFSDGRSQPSCGPFPTLATLVSRLPLASTRRPYYLWRDWAGAQPVPVDWVTGAFLAVERALFDELGGIDPDFFLYYDDVDFCLRARRLGRRAYYLPTAVAYHHHPLAGRAGRSAQLAEIIRRSRRRYFSKHRPGWEGRVLDGLAAAERLVRA